MSNELSDLERALGGRLTRKGEREMPGLNPKEGLEVIYYQDDGRTTARKLFRMLMEGVSTPSAKAGGLVSDPCTIVLPDGRMFRAASYHGDVDGWREDIVNSTCAKGILLGKVDGHDFLVADGADFPLTNCVIKVEG
jgi:hypothetical protein